jgi:hypothetical protein
MVRVVVVQVLWAPTQLTMAALPQRQVLEVQEFNPASLALQLTTEEVEAEVQAPPQLGLVDLVEVEQDLMFRDQLSRR